MEIIKKKKKKKKTIIIFDTLDTFYLNFEVYKSQLYFF